MQSDQVSLGLGEKASTLLGGSLEIRLQYNQVNQKKSMKPIAGRDPGILCARGNFLPWSTHS